MRESLVGQSVEQYRVTQKLGEGSVGQVYRAWDTLLNRMVALKIVSLAALPAGERARLFERFKGDAPALTGLAHPHIARLLGSGLFAGQPYLVSEYVAGDSLAGQAGRKMPAGQAVAVIAPVARALQYAHQHNLLHRNVKPANIMFTSSGVPVLTDLGLVRMLGLSQLELQASADLLRMGPYLAPEHWERRVSAQTDQYALAAVLYELLAGKPPFDASDRARLAGPTPLRLLAPDVPPAVEAAVLRGLSANPAGRFAGLDEFAAEIERATRQAPPMRLVRDQVEDIAGGKGEAPDKDTPLPEQSDMDLRSVTRINLRETNPPIPPHRAGPMMKERAELSAEPVAAYAAAPPPAASPRRWMTMMTAGIAVALALVCGLAFLFSRGTLTASPVGVALLNPTATQTIPLDIVEATSLPGFTPVSGGIGGEPTIAIPTSAPLATQPPPQPTDTAAPVLADTPIVIILPIATPALPPTGGGTFASPTPTPAYPSWVFPMQKILQDRCADCHPGKSDFSVKTYDDVLKALVPGDPDHSLIVQVQSSGQHYGQLTPDELDLLKRWIRDGAPR